MELTDKIRRVYLPMTETGFISCFVYRRRAMDMVSHKRSREMTDSQVSISPGICMGPCQRWKRMS